MNSYQPETDLLIYIIAGEPSGDNLGARIMAALRKATQGKVKFTGIGGPRMTEAGLESLFPMEELSIMGITEILPHIPKLLGRISATVNDVTIKKPNAVLTIDTPAFSFRVAKKLTGRGIPLIHMVAPSVWAWKPWRAKKVAGFLDHLLTLLPFEPPYFEKEGLASTFVGHPVLESGADRGDGTSFRKHHGLDEKQPILCLLPGSRKSETKRLLPVFADVCKTINSSTNNLVIVVPTVPSLKEQISQEIRQWDLPVIVLDDVREKFDAFAASDAALAASGTVSLELAMAKTSAVIAYKVNPLTAWIAKKLVKLDYVSLVNILLKREVVPEFLLERCEAELIAPKLRELLENDKAKQKQLAGYENALSYLTPENGETPSEKAASAILDVLQQRKREG